MRGAGLILLLTAAAMLGNHMAKTMEMRVKRLHLLEMLSTEICSELRYLLPTIPSLIDSLSRRQSFSKLSFLQVAAEKSDSFPQTWHAAVDADKSLRADEQEILCEIGDTIGRIDADAQISAIRLCERRFAALRADAQRRGRLYRNMGVLGEIFLVILLL